MARAGLALEGADDPVRDPSAVEFAGLGSDAFAIDEAAYAPWIEGCMLVDIREGL